MDILLVGVGRMGFRHLEAVLAKASSTTIACNQQDITAPLTDLISKLGYEGPIEIVDTVFDIPKGRSFDAAVLAATANGRLERLSWALDRDIPNILVEKALEQSRARVEKMVALEAGSTSRIKVNHFRRLLPYYDSLRRSDLPIHISVGAGAIGLSVAGIHWLDFAVDLTGGLRGTLAFGELDTVRVMSNRGSQFGDYGGRGLFQFEDGSRLYIDAIADSSAPAFCTIIQGHRVFSIDQMDDTVTEIARDPKSTKPNFLYGQDYTRQQAPRPVERADHAKNTLTWLTSIEEGQEFNLPSIAESAVSHMMLFDLLELSGETQFNIT